MLVESHVLGKVGELLMTRDVVISHDQSNDFPTEQRLILLNQVIQEGVRQSKQSADQAYWSFFLATFMSTSSAVIGLVGAGFLLFGSASEGTVTTAVGIASGMYSSQLSKEAADRQKQANDRLAKLCQNLHSDEN